MANEPRYAEPTNDQSEIVKRLKKLRAGCTDLGNARRLVALVGAIIRYCPHHKHWLIWHGQRWVRDEVGKIYEYARFVIMAIYLQAGQETINTERMRLGGWAHNTEAKYRLEAMVNLAATEPGIAVSPSQLDTDLFLLGVQNGVIDLHTGQLRNSRREDYITKQCPVEFDADADCPRWKEFIDRVSNGDTELAGYLQRMVGYFLTGSTKEQCLFIVCGPGANGKTVFLRVVQTLMGDYAHTTPPETLLVRRNPGAPSPDLARLPGARLVLAFEPNEGAMLAEEVVKRITGQDKIACRRLYGDIFEFIPQFKVVMATNHKPIIRGNDHAIWRRIRLILFTVTIPREEQDRDLIDKLIAELPGILNWTLEGLSAYQSEGLAPPACVVEATEEYRSDMDIIGDWIAECCVEDPDAKVPMKALYASYKAWCNDNGHYPFASKRFGQRLRDRGISVARTSRERLYVGLALPKPIQPEIMDQIVPGPFAAE